MSNYEIYFCKSDGRLAMKYDIECVDDRQAKIAAHALMSRDYKHLEVWHEDQLVYERPDPSH